MQRRWHTDPATSGSAVSVYQTGGQPQTLTPQTVPGKKKKKRASLLSVTVTDTDAASGMTWKSGPIVGRLKQLQKEYFRLTSAPDPSQVRPESVLKKAFVFIMTRWMMKDCDYTYMCSQLKSIRQDAQVQHLRSVFVMNVYETHIRIAIDQGDMGEVIQCLSQLFILYDLHQSLIDANDTDIDGADIVELKNTLLPGYGLAQLVYMAHFERIAEQSSLDRASLIARRDEFVGYRLLVGCLAARQSNVLPLIAALDPSDKILPNISHSLAIREALSEDNYVRFFRLYALSSPPNQNILNELVERVRDRALAQMMMAYRPTLPIACVMKALGFKLESETIVFLKSRYITSFCINPQGGAAPSQLSSQQPTSSTATSGNSSLSSTLALLSTAPLLIDVKPSLPLYQEWQSIRAQQVQQTMGSASSVTWTQSTSNTNITASMTNNTNRTPVPGMKRRANEALEETKHEEGSKVTTSDDDGDDDDDDYTWSQPSKKLRADKVTKRKEKKGKGKVIKQEKKKKGKNR